MTKKKSAKRPSNNLLARVLKSLSTPDGPWKATRGIRDYSKLSPRFVSEKQGLSRILIRFFREETTQILHGKLWLGKECEGPPGHAHGGAVAAVLDEAMGQSAWVAGFPSVAAHIECDFLKPVPLKEILFIKSEIERMEERKVWTRAKIFKADGTQVSESTGLFIRLSDEIIQHFKKHSPYDKSTLNRPMT